MSDITHLRSSRDFQRVYEGGKRYDGRVMVAFLHPNDLPHHRFGITASRKVIGNAVERNRAKRLLRETFRLSGVELESLQIKYDWVLNAKGSLLHVKVAVPLEDFQKIISHVAKDECS